MPRIGLTLGVAALAALSGATAPAADLKVRLQMTTSKDDVRATSKERTQYFTDRMVITEDDKVRAIVDLDAQTLTLVDKLHRTYSVATFETLRARAGKARETAGEMSPGTRLRLGLDSPVTVKRTGRTRQVAGQAAAEYALDSSHARGRVWVAEAIELPPAGREWEKVSASLQGDSLRPGQQLSMEAMKLEGLQMLTSLKVKVNKQVLHSRSEVLEVREESPPAEFLTVPQGYAKQ